MCFQISAIKNFNLQLSINFNVAVYLIFKIYQLTDFNFN